MTTIPSQEFEIGGGTADSNSRLSRNSIVIVFPTHIFLIGQIVGFHAAKLKLNRPYSYAHIRQQFLKFIVKKDEK